MADIGWIVTYDGQSGGSWVREQVARGLAPDHAVEEVVIEPDLHPLRLARATWRLAAHSDDAVDLWVEDVTSLAVRLPRRRRNSVVVLHHLPEIGAPRSVADALNRARNELVLRRLREVRRVVVVSDYWASYLAEHGVTDNVETIYNGLPVERFEFDPEAVAALREEVCDDPGEPLIHVGTCAPGKGGDEAYRALSGMDATLVTTGRKVHDTPVEHYNPPYDDYLRLLAACDAVVAMSDAPEGWGLQVQEAMLCRTPVVGSGRGGMRMLLEGGDQPICRDFDDLEATVRAAIDEQERLGNAGYAYAKQFTLERMLDGWRSLFDELLEDGGSAR